MYNLLVKFSPCGSGRDTMGLDRIFEYTDEGITAQFKDGDTVSFDKLKKLPCLFMQEGLGDNPAYIGTISRARITRNEISIEYTYDREIPPISNALVYQKRHDFDIMHDFEFGLTHWAVKDVDLYHMLLCNSYPPHRQRPIVFNIPDHQTIEPKLASAMMPFDASFNAVYNTARSNERPIFVA
jgi:hypothetical protein